MAKAPINQDDGFDSIETTIDLTDDDKKKKVVAGQDDDLEIEVEDDTPPADRRPPRKPSTKTAIPSDDEIGEYTKGVQDRIKQMKWEYHEERRAKEEWQREHGAAVSFAKRVHDENQKLRKLVETGHKTLLESNKSSAESEIAALKGSLKAALESGNTEAAADIQEKLAKAAARSEAQAHITPIKFEEESAPQQRQAPQQQQVQLSTTMQDWMEENPWFNEDKRMTALAFGIHEELIKKGVRIESPKYFQEIDKGVRDAFPDRFEEDNEEENKAPARKAPAPRRTNVAAVSRTSAATANRVTLTASEMKLANRLGITPQQYAREKQRLETQDNG